VSWGRSHAGYFILAPGSPPPPVSGVHLLCARDNRSVVFLVQRPAVAN